MTELSPTAVRRPGDRHALVARVERHLAYVGPGRLGPFAARGAHCIALRGDQGHRAGGPCCGPGREYDTPVSGLATAAGVPNWSLGPRTPPRLEHLGGDAPPPLRHHLRHIPVLLFCWHCLSCAIAPHTEVRGAELSAAERSDQQWLPPPPGRGRSKPTRTALGTPARWKCPKKLYIKAVGLFLRCTCG